MTGRWPVARSVAVALVSAGAAAAAPPPPAPGTPVGVIGVLDKRMGTSAEFSLRPGGRFEFGRLRGVMQTCTRTRPWVQPERSGAFIQITETPRPRTRNETVRPRMIFSGWLFGHSPSLNAVEDPVYDVWLRSCTILDPVGPNAPGTGGSMKAAAGAPSGAERSTATLGPAGSGKSG